MKKTYRKKFIFPLITVLVIIVIIELLSIPVFYYLNNKSLSKKKIYKSFRFLEKQSDDSEASPIDLTRKNFREDVLHPYLGFVKDYDLKQSTYNNEISVPINRYGFLGEFPENNDSYKIAILGGSVALELFLYSKNTFIKALKESPELKGKQIEVVSLALGGMKQPQQLMTLNYFIAIGHLFDVVINLDGFNEIVLPTCENYSYDVAPFYPRSYNAYTSKSFSNEMLYIISEVNRSKVNQVKYGRAFLSAPIKYSHFALSVYLILNKVESNKQLHLNSDLQEILANKKDGHTSAQEKGPTYKFESDHAYFSFIVNLWARTSLQMHQICNSFGIKYFHFLQPNQYVKGSKILSDWESKNAIAGEKDCYRSKAEFGYTFLIEGGLELKNSGVPFYDLTQLYNGLSTDIYKDNCCHVNLEGNDILAKKIAETIINEN